MNYNLSEISANVKTGPIAVSTSSKNTCPETCPFKPKSEGGNGGCYASGGNLNWHWRKVSEGKRGYGWGDFLLKVGALTRGTKYRHNQAGDLTPKENDRNSIDGKKLAELSAVIKKRKLQAWGYTHFVPKGQNLRAIRAAIKSGFIINVSANNLKEADEYRKKGLPTVVVVAEDCPEKFVTPEGRRGIVCPQQTNSNVKNCAECMLCHSGNYKNGKERGIIIGFRAHGSGKKAISEMVS